MSTGRQIALLMAGIVVIGGAGGLVVENLPRGTSKALVLTIGLGTILALTLWGFIVMTGSLREGWAATRYWVGGLVGIAVALAPLGIPFPWLLFVSIPAGIAAGSWIATGKVWKVWESW